MVCFPSATPASSPEFKTNLAIPQKNIRTATPKRSGTKDLTTPMMALTKPAKSAGAAKTMFGRKIAKPKNSMANLILNRKIIDSLLNNS